MELFVSSACDALRSMIFLDDGFEHHGIKKHDNDIEPFGQWFRSFRWERHECGEDGSSLGKDEMRRSVGWLCNNDDALELNEA